MSDTPRTDALCDECKRETGTWTDATLADDPFVQLARQLERELSQKRVVEWQPIETAPKDGTRILTYRHAYLESMAVAWYNNTGCGEPYWVPVNGPAWHNPTHWMPLPTPPAP